MKRRIEVTRTPTASQSPRSGSVVLNGPVYPCCEPARLCTCLVTPCCVRPITFTINRRRRLIFDVRTPDFVARLQRMVRPLLCGNCTRGKRPSQCGHAVARDFGLLERKLCQVRHVLDMRQPTIRYGSAVEYQLFNRREELL